MAEGQVKQDHILEIAIKRFSHFGINKTTLTEIAEDLNISRQSFLYYFHDKNALIAAVTQRLVDEYLSQVEEVLAASDTIEDGFMRMLTIKKDFINKYSLLALQADKLELASTKQIKTLIQQTRIRYQDILNNFLKTGVARKELRNIETRKTAKLILQTLSAFEHCLKYKSGVPGEEDMKQMFDTQKEVLCLLVNGIKK